MPSDRPVAYVAGPYRGINAFDVSRNIESARLVAAALWRQGYYALCPHMNTAHFDGIVDDRVFLDGALELMRRCDLVVLSRGWAQSEGSREEIREALAIGKPIFEWPVMSVALTEAYFNLD
jgi:hypothetical protein